MKAYKAQVEHLHKLNLLQSCLDFGWHAYTKRHVKHQKKNQ